MNFFKRAGFIALAAIGCSGIAFGDAMFYGISSGRSPWTLYTLSPVTGTITTVAPFLGVGYVTALAFAPGGAIFASGMDILFNQRLLRVDPNTGAVTSNSVLTGVPQGLTPTAYAFSPGGTLFAIYGDQYLYSIDTERNSASMVGYVGPDFGFVAKSFAISTSGTMFLVEDAKLYTLNPTTALRSLVAPLQFDPSFGETAPPDEMTMAFNPVDGRLYTDVGWRSDGLVALSAIDPTTGDVTEITRMNQGVEALAITGTPEPEPSYAVLIPGGLLLLLAVGRRRLLTRLRPRQTRTFVAQ